jgi:hypothetical protein
MVAKRIIDLASLGVGVLGFVKYRGFQHQRIDNSRGAKNASTNFKEWEKSCSPWNCYSDQYVGFARFSMQQAEVDMGFGRGLLFLLLGVPIPIIILLALFWHH